VALLVFGVVLAFVWRLVLPTTAGLGDDEPAATVDGTLVLLGIPFGALSAALVLVRPGSAPVRRALTAILGSLLGAIISWRLGDQLGTPALRAVGAAFSWPVATATFIFLGALLPGTSRRLQTTASAPAHFPPAPTYFSPPY
jgi:hypothetical protein